MSWFEQLTGVTEKSPEYVREHLSVEGDRLHSSANGGEWTCGVLEVSALVSLRERVGELDPQPASRTTLSEVVANVQRLHLEASNTHALFQVASQFNLLEMISPSVTPEQGIGIYERDLTQGPACAIAAGAGTIYRNYFADVNGQAGQTEGNQIDCLSDAGEILGNDDCRLWRMVNGYALPTNAGMQEINQTLSDFDEARRDELRGSLRIGLQWNTEVTLGNAGHLVSQAYCSAMPVSYTEFTEHEREAFARLTLEAAYEATFCAALLNKGSNGCNKVFLTLLGGGAFGNRESWILDAIVRAVQLFPKSGLDVAVVSFGASNPNLASLVDRLA